MPSLGDGVHEMAVRVEDPALIADNRYLLRLSVRGKRPVLVIDGGERSGRRPSLYLEAAVNASTLSPYRLSRMSIRQFEAGEQVPSELLVWNGARGGGERARRRLEEFVTDGGGLVIVAEDSDYAADFDRLFAGWIPAKVIPASETEGARLRPGEKYRFLTDLEMDHPVFVPFKGTAAGAFLTAKFYRYARLATLNGAGVIARLDNGDPALVHAAVGQGRVLIFCSSADDSGNDLPLRTVYVPLWHQMFRFLERFREHRTSYLVGDAVSPRKLLAQEAAASGAAAPDSGQAVVVIDPAQRRLQSDAASDSIFLTRAGFYEIRAEGANTRIAVNVPPAESDLSHADSEELVAGWNQAPPDGPAAVEESEPLTPEEQDKHRNLWRFLVLAATVFLVGEGFLSNRLTVKQG
ncbi:MAG: hypothetical protein HXY20_04425 [Acidobacteria bacterium]|nr:hypothetical protein [Acidobacteriota bacterium]